MSRGIFTDKAYLDVPTLQKEGNKVPCIKTKQYKLYALKLSKVKTKQFVVSNFNIFYKNFAILKTFEILVYYIIFRLRYIWL